jgi:hypothetical protein
MVFPEWTGPQNEKMNYLAGIIPRNLIAVLANCHRCATIWITSSLTSKSPICYGRLQVLDTILKTLYINETNIKDDRKIRLMEVIWTGQS